MNKKIGFLGISTTIARISAGIVGGILAGYVISDYLRRNRIEDKKANIMPAVEPVKFS